MISIATIIQLAGATFPGCNNCKFNMRTKIIDAETKDKDGFFSGENDAYVTLYGVLVRICTYTSTSFYSTSICVKSKILIIAPPILPPIPNKRIAKVGRWTGRKRNGVKLAT